MNGEAAHLLRALLLKVASGMAIVLAFFILLVASSAQQRVMDGLSKVSPENEIGYNEARAAYIADKNSREEERKNSKERNKLRKDRARIEAKSNAIAGGILLHTKKIHELVSAAPADLNCALPAFDRPNVDQDIETGTRYMSCLSVQPGADAARKALIAETKFAIDSINTYRKSQFANQEDMEKIDVDIDAITPVATPSAVRDKLPPDKLQAVFSEVDAIEQAFSPAIGLVCAVPPFVLQMFLAFFAGLFGSLLVTLILIVFPGKDFDITRGSEYYARVVLGGLVSLCVYMVLGAGASLIGGGLSGVDSAKLNIMGLAFICVLAGGFSDRVAGWLSRRARRIFDDAASS